MPSPLLSPLFSLLRRHVLCDLAGQLAQFLRRFAFLLRAAAALTKLLQQFRRLGQGLVRIRLDGFLLLAILLSLIAIPLWRLLLLFLRLSLWLTAIS